MPARWLCDTESEVDTRVDIYGMTIMQCRYLAGIGVSDQSTMASISSTQLPSGSVT